jgi:hypothetical protein
MTKLLGTKPNQAPTNADLGDLAYQDGANAVIGPIAVSGGDVGIGTSSPSALLHVSTGAGQSGSAIVSGGTNAKFIINGDTDDSGDAGEEDAALIFAMDGAYNPAVNSGNGFSGYRIGALNGVAATSLAFTEMRTGSDIEHMRITSSGHLVLGSTSDATDLAYQKRLKISGTGPALYLEETDESQAYAIAVLGGILVIRDATAPASRISLTSAGNVGIGTNSPSVTLSTVGTATYRAVPAVTAAFANTATTAPVVVGNDSGTPFIGAGENSTGAQGSLKFVLGASEVFRIAGGNNLLIGGTAVPTSSAGNIVLYNGTAPTGNATDGVILYAEDVSASSELKVRDEAGNVTTLSPHNFELIPEGPSEDMAWSYYSERDGKRINVDMLKAIRLLEQITGEKLVHMA